LGDRASVGRAFSSALVLLFFCFETAHVKVLVTGGAGFIGSHLAERLLADGADVVVLDDLSTGSLANIEHLIGRPDFEHHIGSITDDALVTKLVRRCHVVVHLAAAVGVRLIVERPVHTIETNVQGTRAVLDAAADAGCRVFLASSSEVYGKSSKIPFAENDDLLLGPTCNSRWAYACSKALDEWLGLAYARERGTAVTITRFFNTVGPRQTGRYGMVLPNFAAQALANEPITVFGSGNQSRCFAHVRDVVEAVVRLLAVSSARAQVFNIGSDREVTMNDLAELVRTAARSTSEIVHVPYDEAYAEGFEDMQRRVPDVRKLERSVGFKPSTPLEKIIDDVVAHQRRVLGC
jgi:UDP-glucose 4-epimerase